MTETEPRCQREAGFRLSKHRGLTLAEVQGTFADCAICDDDGFLTHTDPRGYECLTPCPFRIYLDRIERFNAVRIPERYAHCDLAGFEAKSASQRTALQRVEKHIKQFHPPFPGLLFSGPVGTGKTHLMVSILRMLTLELGVRARFVEFTHMLSDIKEGFSQKRHEAEVLAPICRVPVLGIDELGKGLITDWQLSVLDQVISRRYNAGVTTYFTTNLPFCEANVPVREPVSDHSGDLRRDLERARLQDQVGDRIFSRLHEMCTFVGLDGPDHRLASAQSSRAGSASDRARH